MTEQFSDAPARSLVLDQVVALEQKPQSALQSEAYNLDASCRPTLKAVEEAKDTVALYTGVGAVIGAVMANGLGAALGASTGYAVGSVDSSKKLEADQKACLLKLESK